MESKFLKLLEDYSCSTDDKSAEMIMDHFCYEHDLSYDTYEEEEWSQDGKYQMREISFILSDGLVYGVCESRSGSPFTDWYNQIDNEWYCTDPLDELVLVQLSNDGRQGLIEGLFICTRRELEQEILGNHINFGEILGKHSDISLEFHKELADEKDLTIMSSDADFIKNLQRVLKVSRTISGHNPLDYK